jgi:hypothetical protein
MSGNARSGRRASGWFAGSVGAAAVAVVLLAGCGGTSARAATPASVAPTTAKPDERAQLSHALASIPIDISALMEDGQLKQYSDMQAACIRLRDDAAASLHYLDGIDTSRLPAVYLAHIRQGQAMVSNAGQDCADALGRGDGIALANAILAIKKGLITIGPPPR